MGLISMALERPDAVPYFNWDAPVTNAAVRLALAEGNEDDKVFWIAKIMREARFTALLGRTAPRDLVDLLALLDRGHTLGAALADARTKDAAADPATLAWVLSQWRLGPSVPLPHGVTLEDIERMREQLIERLLVLAVRRDP